MLPRLGVRRFGTTMKWRNAVGEVVLIVVGILLALTATAWYEERRERVEELFVLEELHAALAEDLENLGVALDSFRVQEQRVAALQEHLAAGGSYADSLDRNFGAAYGLRTISVNRASFESLKSRGLGLISNRRLRSRIVRHYDLTYADLALNHEGQRSVILVGLRPYYLTHFRNLEFNQSATPLDYSNLVNDVEFLNLLDYRLQVFRLADLPTHERAVASIDSLMAAIDQEIGR